MMFAKARVALLTGLVALAAGSICLDARQKRPAPSPADPYPAVISGRVVDAGTGKPVGGAVVTLTPLQQPRYPPQLEMPSRISVMTRADGGFTFRSVRGGAHRVEAAKPGYLVGAHGRRRPYGSSRPVEIDAPERVVITIPIWKLAAITGMVVDEAGEPVVGQEMRALQRVFAGGRSHLRISGADLTDDRGVYRIGGLDPASYFVVPSIKQTFGGPEGSSETLSFVPVASTHHIINALAPLPPLVPGSDRLMIYPALFYPGVPSAAQAPPIVLGSGEERTSVDFQMLPIPAARVVGRALEAPPGAHVTLRLLPAGLDDLSEAVVAQAFSDANGTFAFPAVPPGDYVLKAHSSTGEETRWAIMGFPVGQEDVTGVDFVLRPGLRIAGRVEFDGRTQTPGRQTGIQVFAEAADGTNVSGVPSSVTDAGRFTLERLVGGRYVLRVANIPNGWMLRSVTYEGRDVSDVPLVLTGNTTDIVVTLTDRVTQVSGTVRTAASAPDPDALVVIFPADSDAWRDAGPAPRRMRSVRPNKSGEFRIAGLPAGDYYVVALPDEDFGDGSPSMYAALARRADVVRLDEGEKKDLSLQAQRPPTRR